VTFLDGSTSLGPATLNAGGDATLTLATLTAGTHSVTASFGGDSNFSTSASPGVSQSVQDFQILVNGAAVTDGVASTLAQTISAGQVATYTFTVAPTPGATFPAAIALSLAGLPSGFSYTISPSTLAAGSGSQTVTVAIATTVRAAGAAPSRRAPRGMALAMMLPVIGLLGSWFGLRRTKPRVRRAAWLMLLMLALGVMGMVACGGGGTTGYYDYKLASYTLQLNGTGGALQHFTTFNLTVK